jgi:hypothetical protein
MPEAARAHLTEKASVALDHEAVEVFLKQLNSS